LIAIAGAAAQARVTRIVVDTQVTPAFNGATAARLYERHVTPTLTDDPREIARQTLPSTSGAHASLSFLEKVDRWSMLWRGSS